MYVCVGGERGGGGRHVYTYTCIYKYGSLLQNIVSFIGLFCKCVGGEKGGGCRYVYTCPYTHMGWLRLVGCLKI